MRKMEFKLLADKKGNFTIGEGSCSVPSAGNQTDSLKQNNNSSSGATLNTGSCG